MHYLKLVLIDRIHPTLYTLTKEGFVVYYISTCSKLHFCLYQLFPYYILYIKAELNFLYMYYGTFYNYLLIVFLD